MELEVRLDPGEYLIAKQLSSSNPIFFIGCSRTQRAHFGFHKHVAKRINHRDVPHWMAFLKNVHGHMDLEIVLAPEPKQKPGKTKILATKGARSDTFRSFRGGLLLLLLSFG